MAKNQFFKNEDVQIEFNTSDVIHFIEHYADNQDLQKIATAFKGPVAIPLLEGNLQDDMKIELLNLAGQKYTLAELEQRLGSRFELT